MTIPTVPLSSVVVVNPRGWTEPPEPDEPVSFLRMAAVEAGTGKLDPSHHRPWHEVQKGYTRFEEGDVLFAKITPSMENGKAALAAGLVGGRGVGSTEFHVLRPSEEVEPKYLLHFVLQERFRREARAQMRGVAGQLRVPPEFFDDIEIPLPCLDEQKQIVDEIETQFARLDDAVAALERARTRLKRYRASVHKAACEGRLLNEAELARQEGRDYEPASVLLERIKAEREVTANGKRRKGKNAAPLDTSNLPTLPEGWVWTSLGELAEIQGGIQKQPKRAPADNAYPFLRVVNVHRGSLDLSEVHKIELFNGELDKLRLETGDLLIVEGNGSRDQIGRMAIWNGSITDCVHQNHIIRARVGTGILPRFVESYWNSPLGNLSVMNVAASTSGLYTLSVAKVSSIPVPLPPAEEQKRIEEEIERRLSVVDQLEASIEANFSRFEALRQSILRKAFSGRLLRSSEAADP